MSRQMIDAELKSIVHIYHKNGSSVVGTGFLICSPQGETCILTCAHVVLDALKDVTEGAQQADRPEETPPQTPFFVAFPLCEKKDKLRVHALRWSLFASGGGDIAQLVPEEPLPTDSMPARVTPINNNSLFNRPFRAYPFGRQRRSSRWITGNILGLEDHGWLQVQNTSDAGEFVQQGSSGAAAWDDEIEQLVGMFVSKVQSDESRIAWMIPASRLLQFLQPQTGPDTGERTEAHREHYVHREREEELAKDYISRGLPVILKGPRQYGKTMLLNYLLNVTFKEQDNLCVNIHLGGLDAALDSLESLLRAISKEILYKTLEKVGNIEEFKPGGVAAPAASRAVAPIEDMDTRIEEIIARVWKRPLTDVGRISNLLERWILPNLPGNLLIAFGHVEALCNRPYRDNFFRMCKFWLDQNVAASSANPPVQHWARLRLLLEVPRRISLITIESNAGNIGEPIELQDFGLEQIRQLRDYYGLGWQKEELDKLTQMIGGHPYLIDKLMADVHMADVQRKPGQSMDVLLANGYKEQGTFRHFLEELEGRVHEMQLQEVICRIAHNRPYTLEEPSYLKLRDDGMIVEYTDEQGIRRYRLRYPLYKQFMEERCAQS